MNGAIIEYRRGHYQWDPKCYNCFLLFLTVLWLHLTLLKSERVSQSCLTLQLHGLCSTRLLCPWKSPGKNTEEGCHSLLQGIFLTQGLNLGLLHCRQILYHLSHQWSPHIAENIINQLELIHSHLKIGCFHIKTQISLFSWNTGI